MVDRHPEKMNFLVLSQESFKNPSNKQCIKTTQAAGILSFLTCMLSYICAPIYFSTAQETWEIAAPCPNYIICRDKTQTQGAWGKGPCYIHKTSQPRCNSQVSFLTLELAKVCQLKLN